MNNFKEKVYFDKMFGADKEIEWILNDEKIFSAVRKEAEKVGVTPKEYVERFREVFYNEPEKIIKVIQDNLKKNSICGGAYPTE